MAEEWFAIVCDKDQYDENGKLEYRKGDVKSYGTVTSPDNVIKAKGQRKISLGFFDGNPDFSKLIWDKKQEKLRDKTAQEIAAEKEE